MIDPFVIEQSKEDIEVYSKQIPYFIDFNNSRFHFFDPNIYYYGSQHLISFNYNDFSKPLSDGGSVTFIALQFAYFMGFQNVFLFGVDHNYTFNTKPMEVEKIQESDPNHFDPTYFKKNTQWWVPDLKYLDASLEVAKFYFETDGRKIYDCTIDGKLQVFEKMNHELALKQYFEKN